MMDKFKKRLDKENIDNFVVSKGSNLFYLLDIYNISGYLVFKPDDVFLITSNFYKYSVNELDIDSKIYSNGEEKEEIIDDLNFEGKIGSDLPESINEKIDSKVEKSDILEEMRREKTSREVKRIRKACKVTTDALNEVKKNMSSEMTEWELASLADKKIRESGCYNSFETLVHSKALQPHRSPRDKKIGNDLIIIDLGAKYEGYCADMTRTFCLDPSDDQKKLYNDVLDIYNKIFEKIEPGKKFSDLAKHAEKLAKEKGYSIEENFLHRIGHSLGVEIHESPGFDPRDETEIKEGMVFTLEPGLYVPEIGGVRIEDTIYIAKDGKKEILTKFSKDL